MLRSYTLEWLDLTVNITLNPQESATSHPTNSGYDEIIKIANQERDKLQSHLKGLVFAITTKTEIQLVVRQYYSALIILLDRAHSNYDHLQMDNPGFRHVCKTMISCLEDLLSFIETHFSKYLGLDQRVPITYLLAVRTELKQRLNTLKSRISRRIADKTLSNLVFETLYDFANGFDDRKVTFREMLYKKQLIKGLEEISALKPEIDIRKAVTALLIYQNYNKKAFLEYYTQTVAAKVKHFDSLSEKLEELLLSYKEFNQMHRKSGVKLNPNYADVKEVIDNWFVEEIGFLEKKCQFHVSPHELSLIEPTEGVANKIRLSLNADQIAILLRAAVDVGILHTKSVHFAFRTIVPFLASAKEDNLSWDSLRKRSYQAEDKDKTVLIAVLQKVINSVQQY